MKRISKITRVFALLLCVAVLFCACAEKAQPSYLDQALRSYLDKLELFILRSDGTWASDDQGAVDELKEQGAQLWELILAEENIDSYPDTKAFLLLICQYGEVFESYPETEFLALPYDLIHSVWQAMATVYPHIEKDTEDMLRALEEGLGARNWLDGYYLGSISDITWPDPVPWTSPQGYVLPSKG